MSRTLAFKSCLLLLKIFEIDVLEVLRWFALYLTIDRLETSKRTKIIQIGQQTDDYQ
jgi:hypothetical protein